MMSSLSIFPDKVCTKSLEPDGSTVENMAWTMNAAATDSAMFTMKPTTAVITLRAMVTAVMMIVKPNAYQKKSPWNACSNAILEESVT